MSGMNVSHSCSPSTSVKCTASHSSLAAQQPEGFICTCCCVPGGVPTAHGLRRRRRTEGLLKHAPSANHKDVLHVPLRQQLQGRVQGRTNLRRSNSCTQTRRGNLGGLAGPSCTAYQDWLTANFTCTAPSWAAFARDSGRLPGSERDRTMFSRPGSGRNFSGMDSQVFLPITTALTSVWCDVTDVSFCKVVKRQGKKGLLALPPLLGNQRVLESRTSKTNLEVGHVSRDPPGEMAPPSDPHLPRGGNDELEKSFGCHFGRGGPRTRLRSLAGA